MFGTLVIHEGRCFILYKILNKGKGCLMSYSPMIYGIPCSLDIKKAPGNTEAPKEHVGPDRKVGNHHLGHTFLDFIRDKLSTVFIHNGSQHIQPPATQPTNAAPQPDSCADAPPAPPTSSVDPPPPPGAPECAMRPKASHLASCNNHSYVMRFCQGVCPSRVRPPSVGAAACPARCPQAHASNRNDPTHKHTPAPAPGSGRSRRRPAARRPIAQTRTPTTHKRPRPNMPATPRRHCLKPGRSEHQPASTTILRQPRNPPAAHSSRSTAGRPARCGRSNTPSAHRNPMPR